MKKKDKNFDFIASKFNEETITAPASLSEEAVMNKLNKKEQPQKVLSAKSGSRLTARRVLALVACFAVFVATGLTVNTVRLSSQPKPLVTTVGTVNGINAFTGYRQLRNTVMDINKKRERSLAFAGGPLYGLGNFGFQKNDYAVEDSESVTGANEMYGEAKTGSTAESHGETNLQVGDVDEADIIKTDGNYIYYIRPGDYNSENGTSRVMIFSADKDKVKLISEIALPEYIPAQETDAQEMFLCGDRLVVLATYSCYDYRTDDGGEDIIVYEGANVISDGESETAEEPTGETTEESTEPLSEEDETKTSEAAAPTEEETEVETDTTEESTEVSTEETTEILPEPSDYRGDATSVLIYNIKDRSNPHLEARYNQSGYYNTARCIGDYVYLVTQHYSFNYYVPLCGCDDELKNVPIENVAAVDGSDSTDYAVIGAVNIETGKNTQTHALMGFNSNIYCTADHLYLAGNVYEYESNRFNYSYDTHTQLTKYVLQDENITLVSSATIDGVTNDQFSLDEKDGRLRIATTSTNEQGQDTNNLFVLDGDLQEVGKVTGFANNEHIEAVRFLGNTAYVITFEQTDPLFIIDLSDPTAPKITGEVKLDGFSSQLTPVDENTLLGIGWGGDMNASLKLVLFDISDKQNPKVTEEAVFPSAISDAQYSHKALLINRDAGYFAIPIDHNYESHYYDKDGNVVYGGFSYEIGALKFSIENGKFRFENYASGCRDTRCTFIGDYLYTVGTDDSRGGSDSVMVKAYNVKKDNVAHTLTVRDTAEKSFDYTEDDIEAVTAIGTDGKTVTLSKEQTAEFLSLLGAIRLGEEDYSINYPEDGYYIKGIRFEIIRKDGMKTEVQPDGAQCLVDGYALYPVANPDACNALQQFGEQVLS